MMHSVMALSFIFFLVIGSSALGQQKKDTEGTQGSQSCASCHQDSASILPKDHKPVRPVSISSCTACHKPDLSGKPESKPFSARIHKPHVATTPCTLCHSWVAGKEFGVKGAKGTMGKVTLSDMAFLKKSFESWAGSRYMDALHAKGNIVCLACHDRRVAQKGDSVENDRCLSCHGGLESLAARSAPKDFPDRNPHQSHLGDIACTVCHKAHGPSTVYCLGCHQKFKMKIPGE